MLQVVSSWLESTSLHYLGPSKFAIAKATPKKRWVGGAGRFVDLKDLFNGNMITMLFIFIQFSGGKHNFRNFVLSKKRTDDKVLVDK